MRKKIKGYFMLFRILPVMVWSFNGTLVGMSLAVLDSHEIKWLPFFLVLAIAALIQGYPTHIINEIFDWKSGADSRELRAQKSGGSKVLQTRLLSIVDLWKAFGVSHVILILLAGASIYAINAKIIFYFILPGYLSGLFYSLPPFRFSYRPFLGEWLGGFAGMVLLVLGSYYAQTLTLNPLAVLTALAIGLSYIGIMTFFHYLDFEHDQLSSPPKNTTVVFLGLAGSRRYAYSCLLFSAALFLLGVVNFQIRLLPMLLLSFALLIAHSQTDLRNALSIIKWGKVITFSTIIAGLCLAATIKPLFLLLSLPVLAGFWAHKKFGKLKGIHLQV
jgi:1,4-dihydroxy-2-naphthoate octaprenyltransferase